MSTLTREEKRVLIAKHCGIKPKRMWRVYFDADRESASVRIRTYEEAIERKRIEDNRSIGYGWKVESSEPEQYDEWEDAPRYFTDLNAAHEMEMALVGDLEKLHSDVATCQRWMKYKALLKHNIRATAEQRAECFGLAVGLWTA